jgi:hypothetical protein
MPVGNTVGSRVYALDGEHLAYIAGFLDGDGCIACNFEKNKACRLGYRVRIRISFTQQRHRRKVLDVLRSWIKSGSIGEYEHNSMAEYAIRDQGAVQELLVALKPHLVVKKMHAELALNILQAKEGGYTPESLELMRKAANSMRALNRYPKRVDLDPVTTEAFEPRGDRQLDAPNTPTPPSPRTSGLWRVGKG